MSYRLGILTTHPIQYQAPWFRQLAQHTELKTRVFYCYLPTPAQQGQDFGVPFQWDIPLLDGYSYEVLENRAKAPSSGAFSGCDTPGIGKRIADCGFDAFLICGWHVKSHFQALWACRRLGVPTLVRGESNTLTPRSWWKRLRHRLLLRFYSGCLVIGEANRQFYLRSGVSEARLIRAPYFVDNDRFSLQSDVLRKTRDELRQKWNICRDRVTFLYCAKFIAKKHPMDFLHALDIARAQGDESHALLVGDGELRRQCEEFARDRGLPATFVGFVNQSELPAAYAAADCLVLPSDHGETWGLVVNEAMACGLPALVSDQVGCALDLIVEDQTGKTFPCGNVNELARCLIALGSSPATLRTMGERARRHVQDYSIETAVRGTIDAVRLVVKPRTSVR
jgi:glycosyltransferase involved in cell wall biosynthesis